MNVLVLGGSGLLGNAVVRVLADAGDRVAWTSQEPASGLPGRRFSFHLEHARAQQDAALRDLLSTAAPDYIVNCLRGRDEDPVECLAIHGQFPFRLAAQTSCPSLYVSSNAVFRREAREWATTDPPCPETVYGFAKVFGEMAGPTAILRTTFVGLPLRPRSAPPWAVRPQQPDCLWNGVSAWEAARAIRRAIHEGWTGVVHLASRPEPWRRVVEWLHEAAAAVGYPAAVSIDEMTFTAAPPLLLQPTVLCPRPLQEQIAEHPRLARGEEKA